MISNCACFFPIDLEHECEDLRRSTNSRLNYTKRSTPAACRLPLCKLERKHAGTHPLTEPEPIPGPNMAQLFLPSGAFGRLKLGARSGVFFHADTLKIPALLVVHAPFVLNRASLRAAPLWSECRFHRFTLRAGLGFVWRRTINQAVGRYVCCLGRNSSFCMTYIYIYIYDFPNNRNLNRYIQKENSKYQPIKMSGQQPAPTGL